MHYEPLFLFDSPNEDPNEYPQMMEFIVQVESLQAKGLGDFICDNYLTEDAAKLTVFDFGCGPGIYLLPYKACGMTVRGFDACAFAGQSLALEEFRRWDARFRIQQQVVFDGLETDVSDLSICFEIAEHLEEHWADRLVDTLAEHSKRILFTAATPGQGGSYHYNEQPHSYWLKKFQERQGFVVSPFQSQLQGFLERWRPEQARNEVSGWLLNNCYLLEKQ